MEKNLILYEKFQNESLSESLNWRCEPNKWFIDQTSGQLVMHTDEHTDYWQKTHYGFQRDNGHFLYTTTDKNFRLTTKVTASPTKIYDQAGLMIRYSENYWIKASTEYISDEFSKLGAVVTNNGYSDWSTQHIDIEEISLYYRISRIGQNGYVDVSEDGEHWKQIRITHLDIPKDAMMQVGLYACSPQGKGQEVRFDFMLLEELGDNPEEAYI